jgi:hypothetical protein
LYISLLPEGKIPMLTKSEPPLLKTALTVAIALVWLVNGLYCKLLHFVPRHQQIVSRILGEDYSHLLTKFIGGLEILMAVWILSRIKPRWCALAQAFTVALMNCIEFLLAPDLLLFGRWNSMVAAFFITVVLLHEFVLQKPKAEQTLIPETY